MWSGLQIKWLISIQKCKIALKCVKYLNFFWKLHLFISLSKKVREKGIQMESLVSIHFDSNFECKMFWWWIDDNLFLQNGWTMKAVKPYLSRSHCQTFQISGAPRRGFEPAKNLSFGLVGWSCAVVIATTLWWCCVRSVLKDIWVIKGNIITVLELWNFREFVGRK